MAKNSKAYLRLCSQHDCPPGSDAVGELAIFTVDFSADSSRTRAAAAAQPAPPCGEEADFRGRPAAGSPHDQAERRRIHDELAAANLTLRPAPTT